VAEHADPDRPASAGPPDGPAGTGLTEQQRRRLAEVFGDVLPATTADERDDRDRAADAGNDDRLLTDRPPHHDQER
jgi:hypothetical protein